MTSLHENPYEALNVPTVINAVGPMTAIGGTQMSDRTLQAYVAPPQAFCRIEDLQNAAGSVIAEVTGGESGYVTSGASAGIVLAIAACLAELDPALMDRLPNTESMPNEVLVFRDHRSSYDRMITAAGARIVEFNSLQDMTKKMNERTVAAFFNAEPEEDTLSFREFAVGAAQFSVPVVVDAPASLPPQSNLMRFIAQGADLVSFSGGKDIRGPQDTGFLAGRARLITSVAIQHQDMDVNSVTWRRADLEALGMSMIPPSQGIGRSMKVSKEDIIALLAALMEYQDRDHQAELGMWYEIARFLAEEIGQMPGISTEVLDHNPFGPKYAPCALVRVDSGETGLSALEVAQQLLRHSPPVCVSDRMVADGALVINPENLSRVTSRIVAQAFADVITRTTVHKLKWEDHDREHQNQGC